MSNDIFAQLISQGVGTGVLSSLGFDPRLSREEQPPAALSYLYWAPILVYGLGLIVVGLNYGLLFPIRGERLATLKQAERRSLSSGMKGNSAVVPEMVYQENIEEKKS